MFAYKQYLLYNVYKWLTYYICVLVSRVDPCGSIFVSFQKGEQKPVLNTMRCRMSSNPNRGATRKVRRSVPIITGQGMKASLFTDTLRNSGKITVCHGKSVDGTQVNSPAFHNTGKSVVIGVDQGFNVAISMPAADMELLSQTWLRQRGFTITAPSAVQA